MAFPRFSHALIFPVLMLVGAVSLRGEPSPPPAVNMVKNGDFAKFAAQENLWDGIDAGGFLTGNDRKVYAVTDAGKAGNVAMPVSVNFIDLNGDGLPDIATADPLGNFRIYFNSGTKTEPKFTNAEMVPIFLSRIGKDDEPDRYDERHVPKIALHDFSHRGAPDLVVGNYSGEIFRIPNTGSAQAPVFAQPPAYEKADVPTSKNLWGNLFAPCAFDWNKDGKTDLLIGEGSYSANAVHILLNQSSGADLKFNDQARSFLCYGDGREHLVPTVADYNGDGLPDVLVGDRAGTIGAYMNPGNWKPGTELPLGTLVTFGDKQTLGGPVAPYAADYNGDGLFDLLIGKANGHIALAINKGTQTQPKFDAPQDIKGVNLWANNIHSPSNWMVDTGTGRGNLYSYVSVTDEASPDGGKILKAGYFPTPNKVIKMTPITVKGTDSTDFFRDWGKWHLVEASLAGATRQADAFVIRQEIERLKPGAYNLTFKIRGKRVEGGTCSVAALGTAETGAEKVEKGDRGSAKITKNEVHEEVVASQRFSASGTWAVFNKAVQISFHDRALKDIPTATMAMIEFKFQLPQYDGECEIADVQLTPK